MAMRNANDAFDAEGFWERVDAYLQRHPEISLTTFCHIVGFSTRDFRRRRSANDAPSLLMACRMSWVCDFSLDDLRLGPGFQSYGPTKGV